VYLASPYATAAWSAVAPSPGLHAHEPLLGHCSPRYRISQAWSHAATRRQTAEINGKPLVRNRCRLTESSAVRSRAFRGKRGLISCGGAGKHHRASEACNSVVILADDRVRVLHLNKSNTSSALSRHGLMRCTARRLTGKCAHDQHRRFGTDDSRAHPVILIALK
jgi:hypothetical protein